jgi:hypothetical protein
MHSRARGTGKAGVGLVLTLDRVSSGAGRVQANSAGCSQGQCGCTSPHGKAKRQGVSRADTGTKAKWTVNVGQRAYVGDACSGTGSSACGQRRQGHHKQPWTDSTRRRPTLEHPSFSVHSACHIPWSLWLHRACSCPSPCAGQLGFTSPVAISLNMLQDIP